MTDVGTRRQLAALWARIPIARTWLDLISKYDLLAVPVVDKDQRILGIVTVDDVIDALVGETTEDVQKFGGMEALDEPYMAIGFPRMIRKRAGWLAALFIGEMLTATAMGYFEEEIASAVVLALFVPLIISSGGQLGLAGDLAHHPSHGARRRCSYATGGGSPSASCHPASRSAHFLGSLARPGSCLGRRSAGMITARTTCSSALTVWPWR